MLRQLLDSYHRWRRQALPPSVNDLHWRHEYIVGRFAELEKSLLHRFERYTHQPTQQGEILEVLRLLEPKKVVGHDKVRVGSVGDGGYVQIGDYSQISHAFSFGVSDNDDWDLAMANAGIPVEQFDHSVAGAPSKHPLLHFHRKMITAEPSAHTATIPELVAQFSTRDEPDLILKIDIEGSEWEAFDKASEATLSKFTQIMCEFHDLSYLGDQGFRERTKRVFQKLRRSFEVIHVHGNNCGQLCNINNIALPDVLEITFASKTRYAFTENDETFPTALDKSNVEGECDFVLGMFRF